MRTILRSMPAEASALRRPWPTLVGRIPGLTADLEQRFRAGQRVSRLRDGYMLGGSMKGGSSSVWAPVGKAEAAAYEAWARLEGFQADEDRAGFDALRSLCEEAGVELIGGGSGPTGEVAASREATGTAGDGTAADLARGRGARAAFDPRCAGAYATLHALLATLPRAHLGRPELRVIELGGWGLDCAKASAYRQGTVHLYDFALRGARRTFIGLALHELGHAQEHAFDAGERRRLAEAHALLGRSDAFFPIEFLMSASSRISYQRMARSEFLAETYLAYTACGAALRTFVLERPQAERDAWQSVYAIFRDGFHGVEYA